MDVEHVNASENIVPGDEIDSCSPNETMSGSNNDLIGLKISWFI